MTNKEFALSLIPAMNASAKDDFHEDSVWWRYAIRLIVVNENAGGASLHWGQVITELHTMLRGGQND